MKVTYIGHSGFLLEWENCVWLFDYYRGEIPYVSPKKKVLVFVSHSHGDHFNPQIFERFADYPQVEYILASEVRHKVKRCGLSEKESGRVTFLKPHQSWQTKDGCGEDIRLYTCHSTDCGVAFLAEYQGKKIYHAGDLNWWHWEGEDPGWNRNMEVDFKRFSEPLRGRRIDLAMLPLDPRLGADGFRGPRSFLELADIRRFLPMHQWGDFAFTEQFLAACPQFRDRTVPVVRQGQQFTWE